MAEGIPARLTPREGRRFAVSVGGGFVAVAGGVLWRGRYGPPRVMGSVGVLLLLAGVLVPGRLGPVYRAWMGLAHALSKLTTPIFLGVVYFLVMTPIGLVRRVFGGNPMRHVARDGSY